MSKPTVGVLGLTLELYETLAPDLRASREAWLRNAALPALATVVDARFDRAVFTSDDIATTVAGFESAGADALLIVLLTYSPSLLALPALQKTSLPIVIWNVQELAAVDQSFGSPAMIDNHGVHGTQDLANVLLREGVRFEYVTSHLADADPVGELGDCFTAAAGAGRLRNARVGLMGYPFPGMGDFAVDGSFVSETLGMSTVAVTVDEYITRAASASQSDTDALVAEYRAAYDVAPDLDPADLCASARAELAMRGIVTDHHLDALTYQFLAFGEDERTETVPFVAASRMLADGIGFAGEGDVIGAGGTLLLSALSAEATFSEIFTIDFAGNGVFMSHMGECNVAMARHDRKVPLVARAFPITRTQRGQLTLETTLEPGPATLMALTLGPNRRWRLIASLMDVANFTGLTGMQVPYFKLVARTDVRAFLTAYAKAGGPHHNAVCFGDARRRIARAADLLDADYIEV